MTTCTNVDKLVPLYYEAKFLIPPGPPVVHGLGGYLQPLPAYTPPTAPR